MNQDERRNLFEALLNGEPVFVIRRDSKKVIPVWSAGFEGATFKGFRVVNSEEIIPPENIGAVLLGHNKQLKEQIKQTLIDMRARIERGWTQYAPARDAEGQIVLDYQKAEFVCMRVALRLSQGDDAIRSASDAYLMGHIQTTFAPHHRTLVGFNDDRGTTKDKVLAAIDVAIASLEVQQ